ncbi:Uncharacterised protein [Mycobacteroides abscessus]|nr:Uncharacterised protein [Mycobacteroides abscessus]
MRSTPDSSSTAVSVTRALATKSPSRVRLPLTPAVTTGPSVSPPGSSPPAMTNVTVFGADTLPATSVAR